MPGNTTGPDNDPTPPPPDGVAAFSVEPMTTSGTLTPLGALNPPGHVLPTNHVYFYAIDFDHARMRRIASAPDNDGHIDLDVPGRLAGSWYEQSLPLDSTEGPSGWPRTVAFATDYYDPSLVRVSIGGTIAASGLWTIPATAPRPGDVSMTSGLVAYPLMYTGSTNIQAGLMLVQMIDATHLKIEVFPGSQATSGAFDGAAFTYVR
jgi:hypothetical protein